ncbi:hypothetical protein OZN62_11445 [Aurantiacibacter sp. MUD11]|uniref:hypothetical protein n=1 Tax=Aurantiacibacter sp. MUD11 TaxID=3003265 RepID=UPI0022AAE818|nr:hypothetical protein [Aurantiacibacter sp. MUD11]WAT17527.1 hypothetical protein OZN62_11445 [Aurantiacibacter sp. MUD11]
MKATRRSILAGAAAIPVAAGLSKVCWHGVTDALFCYDAHIPTGAQLAEAARGEGVRTLALGGDRIRQAREVFARRPALVRGVSRQADAVLFEDVGHEAGYELLERRVDGVMIDWTLAPRNRA